VTDRFLFQLGFATLALGVAMIAVPWLGAEGAVIVLAASAIAWRARPLRPASPRASST
jgi:hypothetical protein